MIRRPINLDEARQMILDENRDVLNCRLDDRDEFERFWWDEECQEYCSGDFVEMEGENGIVVDRNGNILRYDGYYFEILP